MVQLKILRVTIMRVLPEIVSGISKLREPLLLMVRLIMIFSPEQPTQKPLTV